MLIKEETTQIGFIQKSHGVKGELSLALIDGLYTDDLDTEFLLLNIDHGLVPFYVESYRIKSSKNMLVKLESIDTETRASELCGIEVYIENSQLEEKQERTNIAYIGYQVNDQNKGYIGKITEIQEITNNPLFILSYEGKEIIFPIHPDFILDINKANKTLQVNLPEGLIDLYLQEDTNENDM